MIKTNCTLCTPEECKKNISTMQCLEKIEKTYPDECREKIKIIEQYENKNKKRK
jgi:hypothetical protein